MIEERKQETVKGGINCIDAEKTATRTGNTRQRVYPLLCQEKRRQRSKERDSGKEQMSRDKRKENEGKKRGKGIEASKRKKATKGKKKKKKKTKKGSNLKIHLFFPLMSLLFSFLCRSFLSGFGSITE